MKIWLLCGLWRPEFSENLRSIITRLSCGADVRAVVVATGVPFEHPKAVVVSEPERGVVPFLRTGLAKLRELSQEGDWFARIDSDDYYGIGYLDQIRAKQAEGFDFTGASSIYVKTEESKLYYCKKWSGAFFGAFGGTIAGNISKACNFTGTSDPWGEDVRWVQDMLALGHKGDQHAALEYALVRHENGNHTYPVTGSEFPHFSLCQPYDAGDWCPQKLKEVGDSYPKIKQDMQLAWTAVRRLRDISLKRGEGARALMRKHGWEEPSAERQAEILEDNLSALL